jgi:hypothetical protein
MRDLHRRLGYTGLCGNYLNKDGWDLKGPGTGRGKKKAFFHFSSHFFFGTPWKSVQKWRNRKTVDWRWWRRTLLSSESLNVVTPAAHSARFPGIPTDVCFDRIQLLGVEIITYQCGVEQSHCCLEKVWQSCLLFEFVWSGPVEHNMCGVMFNMSQVMISPDLICNFVRSTSGSPDLHLSESRNLVFLFLVWNDKARTKYKTSHFHFWLFFHQEYDWWQTSHY